MSLDDRQAANRLLVFTRFPEPGKVKTSLIAALGRRMEAAFERSFAGGAEKAVIVGTDCPGLSGRLMLRAFDELDHASLVLGPAYDGGYYLIGLREPLPRLFAGMPWGTEEVLKLTVDRAREINAPTSLLIPLDDVDRPEDLPVWESAAAKPGREGDGPGYPDEQTP